MKVYSGEHEAQVPGTIALAQISNANKQQLTIITEAARSDLATQTVSRSLIMIVTTISIALSSPAFQLALQTKLQTHPSFRLPPFIYPCSTGRDVTWNYLVLSHISSPNRDIEKMTVFSGIFDLSPKWSPRSGVRAWPLPVIPYLPL
ncbi:hypothetical protein AVEN_188138-1 [Araneus ventricosus]|uniref:Uncharacterized protein n=1 Tax=Araneus ventricosus TaxID=182803 RepID=A0A4Y2WQA9_ARAVE|nr:hypothetical protein AVEN_7778-1 [Araneus ventricosus]GBO38895.1 hypothetical protein AVEN_95128-1 [Araneus ventricosus]GBO38898.1 hypothetical protein AVEN_141998-1 [Araneus ventricosus]GBO38901.1 hypothetical protein AVEN_188138-1 [Araneus ventricosus]